MTAQTSRGCVLIIEDDADTREILAELLANEGYRTASAANGLEGIHHLRGTAPTCVVLLDLMMPVMNGWEFRAEQQQDPALAQIPVVVLSGDGNVKQKAATLSAADYLPKPVDLDRLLEIVARFCG